MCAFVLRRFSPLLQQLLPLLLLLLVTTMMDMAEAVVVDVGGLSGAFWDAMGTASVGEVVQSSPESGLNQTCFDSSGGYSNLKACLISQCVSSDDVAKLYGVTSEQQLDAGNLSVMSAGLLYTLTQKKSCSSEVPPPDSVEPPTVAAVWGYGFLFVTLINFCSLFGACVLPCIRAGVYKVMLLFMVSLAVGTLVGSGLLVLIPEAMELPTLIEGHHFLWKATTVMGGIYLFFLMERIMRIINSRRENTKEKKERDQQATEGTYTSFFQRNTPENPTTKLKDPDLPGGLHNRAFEAEDERVAVVVSSGGDPTGVNDDSGNRSKDGEVGSTPNNGTAGSSLEGGQRVKIAPVAYMIIFGDALHNLIDGLSIGAAFTESTLLGISLSVAVMCEELPHELGDFAILLNSGMSMRKALLFNFLSSLSCYLGLIIGIQLGENTSANTWIFAIAGGMFLYISLADMLPEMNSAAESEDGKNFGEIKTFLVQNLGLLIGYGIILLLSVYAEKIQF